MWIRAVRHRWSLPPQKVHCSLICVCVCVGTLDRWSNRVYSKLFVSKVSGSFLCCASQFIRPRHSIRFVSCVCVCVCAYKLFVSISFSSLLLLIFYKQKPKPSYSCKFQHAIFQVNQTVEFACCNTVQLEHTYTTI